jgi:hypothetical protein
MSAGWVGPAGACGGAGAALLETRSADVRAGELDRQEVDRVQFIVLIRWGWC